MDRGPWTDARIGDAFRSVWERLNALDRTNERLATMEAVIPEVRRELAGMRSDVTSQVGECRSAIEVLSHAFTERAAAREAERKERERERKLDRRWLVGTVIAASAVVVGAVGFLLQVLESAPG